MTSKEPANQAPIIIGIVVSEETRPTPAEYTFQLVKCSEVRVGDFVITDGAPRILGTVSDVIPQHLYFKMPLLVESSLDEDFNLKDEAPPSCSWTLAKVSVLGELGESDFSFSGRAPHPGQRVTLASSSEITESLGLKVEGVALGVLSSRPYVMVSLDPTIFMNEHVVTFGVTRFGKSYSNAVIIEEFAKSCRPVFIIDPHGEYYSFSIANDNVDEIQSLPKNLSPRLFKTVVYSPPMFREKEERELTISFSELEASEIVELTGIEGENQIALVYETVRGLQKQQPYDLETFVESMRDVKDELKLNVQSESIIARLRVLQRGIGVFGQSFNPQELIVPGQITVVNLSGLDLRAQQILVTTLLRRLFYERQWGNIPPFSVAIDEAQRFAPEGSDPVSKRVIEELVKEGLKFGVNVLAMSQRPTELSPTIRSQAETRIFHRLSESADVNYVTGLIEKASPGASEGITRLSKGEAIIWGGCTNYTAVRMRIRSRQSKHAGRTGTLRLRKKITNGNGTKQTSLTDS
jgi:hypothetical protein